jgi:very-short-patch-repair endonuclease
MAQRGTVLKARRLRREMTLPEVLVWRVLRGRPEGYRFRRQHPSGLFVADFYCASARLVIEVDGVAHEMGDRLARDVRRDAWLAEQGVAVLRIPAKDVLHDLDAVVRLILRRCVPPLHQPSAGPPPHAAHGED